MGMVLMIALMNYQKANVGNPMHVMGRGNMAQLIPILLDARRLVICAKDGRRSTALLCCIKSLFPFPCQHVAIYLLVRNTTTPFLRGGCCNVVMLMGGLGTVFH